MLVKGAAHISPFKLGYLRASLYLLLFCTKLRKNTRACSRHGMASFSIAHCHLGERALVPVLCVCGAASAGPSNFYSASCAASKVTMPPGRCWAGARTAGCAWRRPGRPGQPLSLLPPRQHCIFLSHYYQGRACRSFALCGAAHLKSINLHHKALKSLAQLCQA